MKNTEIMWNYTISRDKLTLATPSDSIAKDLSFDEKLDKIQRYLPEGLTEKILGQKEKIEGERKQVTVMFCDMEGFTPLVERIGAEESYSIMDQVYEILIHKVHDYGGTVNEMTGDGIMALFGAPVALEDAPQRAIRSAIAIHLEMARFSDRMKQNETEMPTIKMRVGIHTGRVVVGSIGNSLRVEFKVVGDTVNLASRMEGLAEPGTTYVTGETFKLTEGFFRFEGLGERKVKGREKLVNVYRVIAPSTRRTRFDVSTERGLTHFVGRERELELLLDGFERAKSGRGQAFSIMAEPGIGKSRLLYEFRKGVSNEDADFLEGKCLSYSRGVAYHPVIDILKANFDIRDGDGDTEVREKVKEQLKALEADEASTLPYLLELLSVKDSGIDKLSMSPEGKKERITEALKRIVLKASEIRPLIIAVEDLHWIDKSSEDVFKDLLNSIAGTKVFLIFTYRPQFVYTWGMKSFHSQVNLNRLSNKESLAMEGHILGTEHLEGDVEQFILEKTEGVPFFIEEFIKSIKDLKIVEKKDGKYRMAKDTRDVTIPSTIQDVIMARVDSLTEGARDLIQTGSAIEREFSCELIKRVTGLSEQALLSHLSALRDSELVYERGIFPQSTYIFKHALTRDVVYESILKKRKKRLHGDIAKAIKDLYQKKIDEYYEILVEHFIASETYDMAAEYSKLASKKAEKAGALTDSIRYTRKGIDSLEKLQITYELQSKIIDARTTLGLYLFQMFYFLDAKNAIDPISELAIGGDSKRRIAQIYTILGAYYFWCKEDMTEAIRYLELALEIAEETSDVVCLFFANHYLGIMRASNCEFDKAVNHFNVALNINLMRKTTWGISAVKSALSYWGYSYQSRGDMAFQTSQEALSMAEESGDIYSKAGAYGSHGYSCFYKGYLHEAEKNILSSVDFCERINLFAWEIQYLIILATVYLELKNYQKAEMYYAKAFELADHNCTDTQPSVLIFCKIQLSLAKFMDRKEHIDMKKIYSLSAANRLKTQEGWIRRSIGQLLSYTDISHLSEAEKWIKSAIKEDSRNGAIWHMGMDYAVYAEMFKRKGDRPNAKEKLNRAIKILKRCGADGWVEKYEKKLTALL